MGAVLALRSVVVAMARMVSENALQRHPGRVKCELLPTFASVGARLLELGEALELALELADALPELLVRAPFLWRRYRRGRWLRSWRYRASFGTWRGRSPGAFAACRDARARHRGRSSRLAGRRDRISPSTAVAAPRGPCSSPLKVISPSAASRRRYKPRSLTRRWSSAPAPASTTSKRLDGLTFISPRI